MTGVDPALYRPLEALPETQIGEILRGELFASPRPAPRHGRVIIEPGRTLLDPFDHGHQGAVFIRL